MAGYVSRVYNITTPNIAVNRTPYLRTFPAEMYGLVAQLGAVSRQALEPGPRSGIAKMSKNYKRSGPLD